jgi:hypothetical protein
VTFLTLKILRKKISNNRVYIPQKSYLKMKKKRERKGRSKISKSNKKPNRKYLLSNC